MDATKAVFEKSSLKNVRTMMTLGGIAMAIFMSALENTVVGTAMPTVIASLGGIEIYSWVFAAYILAATIMTPVWGKMSDLIGRRPAMFGGLGLFILGSALSGASQTMGQLITFRTLQGLGAAAIFPIGMTMVADLLTLEQRAKTIGLFSGMWGMASLIGPIVGGYLTAYTRLSWRWCFYIILPFGLLSAVMIWWSYQERFERKEKISIDYPGLITLTAALVILLFQVERATELSVPLNLALLAASITLLLVFIKIELREPEPLIPLEIFRGRVVAMSTLHGFFAMMALIGATAFLPLFVQAVIGTNAAEAGRILIPFILPWVIASIIGGRLILRFGYRPLVLTGMVLMLIGAAMLAMASTETTRLGLSIDVIFLGLGGGLTIVTLMIAAQHAVPRTQLGVVTSTVLFSRSIGAAIGVAVMGSIMSWRLGRLLTGAPAEISHFASKSEIGMIVKPETRRSISPFAAKFLQDALSSSLRAAFIFILVAVAIAAMVALFVPGGGVHDLAHHEHRPD